MEPEEHTEIEYSEDFSEVVDDKTLFLLEPPEGWKSTDDVRGNTDFGGRIYEGDGSIRSRAGEGGELYSPAFNFEDWRDITISWLYRGTSTSEGTLIFYYRVYGGAWNEIKRHDMHDTMAL